MASGCKRVLCVGMACLDIVNVVSNFPIEDSDDRDVLEQRWQRGGNAGNSCTVLVQLGVPCEYLGCFGRGLESQFVVDDLCKRGIIIENCVHYGDCRNPLSCIIINESTGSRTIMNYNKKLPELPFEAFEKLDLSQYCWIQFEGRNVHNVSAMMRHVRNHSASQSERPIIALELEICEPQLESLIPLADVVFVAKDFAKFRGCNSMSETVDYISQLTQPETILICPWGEEGAMAKKGSDGDVVMSPAFPPLKVVDTLGAGDTFNAATIYGIVNGKSLHESITLGCKVAGIKVGLAGYDDVGKEFRRRGQNFAE